jgi:hypothetical protein
LALHPVEGGIGGHMAPILWSKNRKTHHEDTKFTKILTKTQATDCIFYASL